jgi:hypothetical protein
MSDHTIKPGETFQLEGHCMVAYPDGTVVTANGGHVFKEPGEYRVIYADDDTETVTVEASGSGTNDTPEPADAPATDSAAPPVTTPQDGPTATLPPAAPIAGVSTPAPVQQPANGTTE